MRSSGASSAPVAVPSLYPAQAAAVGFTRQRIGLGGKPGRLIWAWETGCGKGVSTCALLQAVAATTSSESCALVVCPASVREHWYRELRRWAPSLVVECVRPGVGAQKVERDLAYQIEQLELRGAWRAGDGKVVVVSYDMLGKVDAEGYSTIVFDELHHLAWPKSRQSKLARAIVAANPQANMLGLTATLSPTEIKQIWHPLFLLFGPSVWGRMSATGDQINWAFKSRYCEVEKNEAGFWEASGAREDRRAELHDRLAPYVHYLTRADIAANIPPLYVTTHSYDYEGQHIAERICDWLVERASVTHIVVLLHKRADAQAVYHRARNIAVELCQHEVCYIDGSMPVERRDRVRMECERAPRAILVATHDSLREGVRLMWANEVFLGQWPQSPGQLLQILGRFNSVGHPTARPHVNLIASNSAYGRASNLVYRLGAMQDVLCSTGALTQLKEQALAMRDGKGDSDSLAEAWLGMFEGMRDGGEVMGEAATP